MAGEDGAAWLSPLSRYQDNRAYVLVSRYLLSRFFPAMLQPMKGRNSGKKGPAPGAGGVRQAYDRAARDLARAADHVDQALAQWAREMPDVEIKGADVLNRARRIVLQSRSAIEANFRRHGLDTGEFDVLATLRRAGEPYGLRPTELYRSLMISSGG